MSAVNANHIYDVSVVSGVPGLWILGYYDGSTNTKMVVVQLTISNNQLYITSPSAYPPVYKTRSGNPPNSSSDIWDMYQNYTQHSSTITLTNYNAHNIVIKINTSTLEYYNGKSYDLKVVRDVEPLYSNAIVVTNSTESGKYAYIDGVKTHSPDTSLLIDCNNTRIGGFSIYNFDGDIYEIMLFSRELKHYEVDKITNYLRTKWNAPPLMNYSLINSPYYDTVIPDTRYVRLNSASGTLNISELQIYDRHGANILASQSKAVVINHDFSTGKLSNIHTVPSTAVKTIAPNNIWQDSRYDFTFVLDAASQSSSDTNFIDQTGNHNISFHSSISMSDYDLGTDTYGSYIQTKSSVIQAYAPNPAEKRSWARLEVAPVLDISKTNRPSTAIFVVATPTTSVDSYLFANYGTGAGAPALISGYNSKNFEFYGNRPRAQIGDNGASVPTIITIWFSESSSQTVSLYSKLSDGTSGSITYSDGDASTSVTPVEIDTILAAGLNTSGGSPRGFFTGKLYTMMVAHNITYGDRLTIENYLYYKYFGTTNAFNSLYSYNLINTRTTLNWYMDAGNNVGNNLNPMYQRLGPLENAISTEYKAWLYQYYDTNRLPVQNKFIAASYEGGTYRTTKMVMVNYNPTTKVFTQETPNGGGREYEEEKAPDWTATPDDIMISRWWNNYTNSNTNLNYTLCCAVVGHGSMLYPPHSTGVFLEGEALKLFDGRVGGETITADTTMTVDLGGKYDISSVRLWPINQRYNADHKLLEANAGITSYPPYGAGLRVYARKTGNRTWDAPGNFPSERPVVSGSNRFMFNAIRIITTTNTWVHVSEIQIWVNGINVASSSLGSVAYQNTTHNLNYPANYVNDSGNDTYDGSSMFTLFNHTNQGTGTYVMITLSQDYALFDIEEILVYNRSDYTTSRNRYRYTKIQLLHNWRVISEFNNNIQENGAYVIQDYTYAIRYADVYPDWAGRRGNASNTADIKWKFNTLDHGSTGVGGHDVELYPKFLNGYKDGHITDSLYLYYEGNSIFNLVDTSRNTAYLSSDGKYHGPYLITVGTSPSSNTKTITLDSTSTTPSADSYDGMMVYPDPYLNGEPSHYSDTFSTSVSGTTLTVTRTDSSGGWGQDLQLKAVRALTLDSVNIEYNVSGGYIDFSNSGSNKYCINVGNVDLQCDWSLEIWVNFDNITNNQALFGQGVGANNQGLHIHTSNSGSKLRFGMFNNDLDCTFSPVLSTGSWYHFVFTYNNSTGTKQIYFNGSIHTNTSQEGSQFGYLYNGTGDLAIGKNLAPTTTQTMLDGKVSQVRMYTKVLSAAEVTHNYNNTGLNNDRDVQTWIEHSKRGDFWDVKVPNEMQNLDMSVDLYSGLYREDYINNKNTVQIYLSAGIPNEIPGLYAAYDGNSFDDTNNVWRDKVGGHDTTSYSGNPTISSTLLNGHPVVKGGVRDNGTTKSTTDYDGLTFPEEILPTTYTLFHVARYTNTGTSDLDKSKRDRIFQATDNNWLSGFWDTRVGVAHHTSWLTHYGESTYVPSSSHPMVRNHDDWLLSTDIHDYNSDSALSYWLYRGNKTLNTNGLTNNRNITYRLTINDGQYTGEMSDWEVAEIIVYNRRLSLNEINTVENYLAIKYNLLQSTLPPVYRQPLSWDILNDIPGIYAVYDGHSFDETNNVWRDRIGDHDIDSALNNGSSVGGNPTKPTTILNGHPVVSGGTSDSLTFPTEILPTTYTLFHVARYTNTTDSSKRERIFTNNPSSTNWLSGFHGNKAGVAYHNDWMQNSAVNTGINDWLLSTDVHDYSTNYWLYRNNKDIHGSDMDVSETGNNQNVTFHIGINTKSTEVSEWEVAEVIVYNRRLSLYEIKKVEHFLATKYNLPSVLNAYSTSRLGNLALGNDENAYNYSIVQRIHMAEGDRPGPSILNYGEWNIGVALFTYVGYIYLDKTQGNYAHFTEKINDLTYLRIGPRDADTSSGLSNLSLVLNDKSWGVRTYGSYTIPYSGWYKFICAVYDQDMFVQGQGEVDFPGIGIYYSNSASHSTTVSDYRYIGNTADRTELWWNSTSVPITEANFRTRGNTGMRRVDLPAVYGNRMINDIAIEFYEEPAVTKTWKRLLFKILAVRGPNTTDGVQIGEMKIWSGTTQLTSSNLSALDYSSLLPDYTWTSTLNNNPHGRLTSHPASKLFDGLTSNNDKWFNYCGEAAYVIITLDQLREITKYQFTTAGDGDYRDPVSWEIYGSRSDTEDKWILLDRRLQETTGVPTARQADSSEYTIDQSLSTDALTQLKLLEFTANFATGSVDSNPVLTMITKGHNYDNALNPPTYNTEVDFWLDASKRSVRDLTGRHNINNQNGDPNMNFVIREDETAKYYFTLNSTTHVKLNEPILYGLNTVIFGVLTTTSSQGRIIGNHGGNDSTPAILSGYNSKDFQFYWNDGSTDRFLQIGPASGTHSTTSPSIIAIHIANRRVSAYWKTESSDGSVTSTDVFPDNLDIDTLFSGFHGSTELYSGRIYEFLVMHNVTDSGRTNIIDYLANKWIGGGSGGGGSGGSYTVITPDTTSGTAGTDGLITYSFDRAQTPAVFMFSPVTEERTDGDNYTIDGSRIGTQVDNSPTFADKYDIYSDVNYNTLVARDSLEFINYRRYIFDTSNSSNSNTFSIGEHFGGAVVAGVVYNTTNTTYTVPADRTDRVAIINTHSGASYPSLINYSYNSSTGINIVPRTLNNTSVNFYKYKFYTDAGYSTSNLVSNDQLIFQGGNTYNFDTSDASNQTVGGTSFILGFSTTNSSYSAATGYNFNSYTIPNAETGPVFIKNTQFPSYNAGEDYNNGSSGIEIIPITDSLTYIYDDSSYSTITEPISFRTGNTYRFNTSHSSNTNRLKITTNSGLAFTNYGDLSIPQNISSSSSAPVAGITHDDTTNTTSYTVTNDYKSLLIYTANGTGLEGLLYNSPCYSTASTKNVIGQTFQIYDTSNNLLANNTLSLEAGTRYIFDLSDSTNVGYDFRLSNAETSISTPCGTLVLNGTSGSSSANLSYTVGWTENTELYIYDDGAETFEMKMGSGNPYNGVAITGTREMPLLYDIYDSSGDLVAYNTLNFKAGMTYVFDTSHSSNTIHPESGNSVVHTLNFATSSTDMTPPSGIIVNQGTNNVSLSIPYDITPCHGTTTVFMYAEEHINDDEMKNYNSYSSLNSGLPILGSNTMPKKYAVFNRSDFSSANYVSSLSFQAGSTYIFNTTEPSNHQVDMEHRLEFYTTNSKSGVAEGVTYSTNETRYVVPTTMLDPVFMRCNTTHATYAPFPDWNEGQDYNNSGSGITVYDGIPVSSVYNLYNYQIAEDDAHLWRGTTVPPWATNSPIVALKYDSQLLGDLMSGDSQNDYFGTEIGLNYDGTRIAIGTGLISGGYVKIFDFNGTSWNNNFVKISAYYINSEPGNIVANQSDMSTIRYFGSTLSFNKNGNILAIGSSGTTSTSYSFSGFVQIYNYNNNSWSLMTTIYGTDGSQRLGKTISLNENGDRIAIGGDYNTHVGIVKIYNYDGNNWVPFGEIGGPGAGYSTDFIYYNIGYSISLNGDGTKLAIGTYPETGASQYHRPKAFIYEYDNTAWNQQSVIEFSDKTKSPVIVDFSNDGNRIVIALTTHNIVKIYDYNTLWRQVGIDITGENANISYDGQTVSILSSGNGRLYKYIQQNVWIQNGNDYGNYPILSGDGERFAIGSPSSNNNTGSANVYLVTPSVDPNAEFWKLQDILHFLPGSRYTIDLSHSSNLNNTLNIATTASATTAVNGLIVSGVSGSSGASLVYEVPTTKTGSVFIFNNDTGDVDTYYNNFGTGIPTSRTCTDLFITTPTIDYSSNSVRLVTRRLADTLLTTNNPNYNQLTNDAIVRGLTEDTTTTSHAFSTTDLNTIQHLSLPRMTTINENYYFVSYVVNTDQTESIRLVMWKLYNSGANEGKWFATEIDNSGIKGIQIARGPGKYITDYSATFKIENGNEINLYISYHIEDDFITEKYRYLETTTPVILVRLWRVFNAVETPSTGMDGEMAITTRMRTHDGVLDNNTIFAYRTAANLYVERISYLPFNTGWVNQDRSTTDFSLPETWKDYNIVNTDKNELSPVITRDASGNIYCAYLSYANSKGEFNDATTRTRNYRNDGKYLQVVKISSTGTTLWSENSVSWNKTTSSSSYNVNYGSRVHNINEIDGDETITQNPGLALDETNGFLYVVFYSEYSKITIVKLNMLNGNLDTTNNWPWFSTTTSAPTMVSHFNATKPCNFKLQFVPTVSPPTGYLYFAFETRESLSNLTGGGEYIGYAKLDPYGDMNGRSIDWYNQITSSIYPYLVSFRDNTRSVLAYRSGRDSQNNNLRYIDNSNGNTIDNEVILGDTNILSNGLNHPSSKIGLSVYNPISGTKKFNVALIQRGQTNFDGDSDTINIFTITELDFTAGSTINTPTYSFTDTTLDTYRSGLTITPEYSTIEDTQIISYKTKPPVINALGDTFIRIKKFASGTELFTSSIKLGSVDAGTDITDLALPLHWNIDKNGSIYTAEITDNSLLCGRILVGNHDLIFTKHNWVFEVEGKSETGSKTYQAISWGGSSASSTPNSVQDVVGDGNEYIWLTEQASLSFDGDGVIAATGSTSYGGTIPQILKDDAVIVNDDGQEVLRLGLTNYRYSCGDTIIATGDAFIVYDKSERMAYTWGYNHLTTGGFPGQRIENISSVFGYTNTNTNKHYFLAKKTFAPFMTCNLAQPGCSMTTAQRNTGGFISWGARDTPSFTSTFFGLEIFKLTDYLLSQKFKYVDHTNPLDFPWSTFTDVLQIEAKTGLSNSTILNVFNTIGGEELLTKLINGTATTSDITNTWPTDFPWQTYWDAVLTIDPNLSSPYGEYKNFEIDGIYNIDTIIYIRLLRTIAPRYFIVFKYDTETYSLDTSDPIILPDIVTERYTTGAVFIQTDFRVAYIWGNPDNGGNYNYKYSSDTIDTNIVGSVGTTTPGFTNQNKLVFNEDIADVISNDHAFVILGWYNQASQQPSSGYKIMAVWGNPSKGGLTDENTVSRIESNIGNTKPIVKIVATKDSFALLFTNGSVVVWGSLTSQITVLDSCGFETGATILDPYEYFIDAFSTRSSFVFMHSKSQRLTETTVPSSTDSETDIVNYLYGNERTIKWGLNPRLEINYMFLENKERCWLAENPQNILIEKLYNVTYYQNENETTFTSHIIPLETYHPTKLLVLVPKRSDTVLRNDFSNYTNWEDMDSDPRFNTSIKIITRDNYETYTRDIITGVQIRLNKNNNRLRDEKIGSYFSTLQKHQHKFSFDESGIPVYSFCLNPKDITPSGAINFSELNNISLKVNTIPVDQFVCNAFIIDAYLLQYNTLSIVGGVAGLKYGN